MGPRGGKWILWLVVVATFCDTVAAQKAETSRLAGTGVRLNEIPGPSYWDSFAGEVLFEPARSSSFSLSSNNVSGELVQTRYEFSAVAGLDVSSEEPQTNKERIAGARLQIRANSEDSRILLRLDCFQAGGAFSEDCLSLPGPMVQLEAADSSYWLFPEFRQVIGGEKGAYDPHVRYIADPARIRSMGPNALDYEGHAEIFLWEAELLVVEADGETQRYVSGREEDAKNSPPLRRHVDTYLHIAGSLHDLRVSSDEPPYFWLETGSGRLDTAHLSMEGVEGGLETPSGQSALRRSHVELSGRNLDFLLGARTGGRPSFDFEIGGEFDRVVVDGIEVPLSANVGPQEFTGIAAAGIGLAAFGSLAAAVAYWLKQASLPLLARRASEQAMQGYVGRTLQNPVRQRIHQLIKQRPGIQPFHVWKAVGGAFGVTLRSLDRLEEVGLVRSRKLGRYRHYFVASATPTDSHFQKYAVLAEAPFRETYSELCRRGGATQQELQQILGRGTSTISDRLVRLESFGLVGKVRASRAARYVPLTPEDGHVASSLPSPPIGVFAKVESGLRRLLGARRSVPVEVAAS